jgi:tetratricopeptide (TPR) repeat protein
MALPLKYRAFISYSHTDEKWAAWLHTALETYRLPKSLVGQETPFGVVPARISPVFRDRDELASATDLGEVLTQALRDSACQIVICSPAAARSHWVNEEVLTYKRLGRADRVFCLIVGGEPNAKSPLEEAFPEAVRFKLDASGALSREPAEPIAADARAGKDGKQNAKLKIVAGMLGVGLDVLKQREHHRRQRRLAVLAAAAVVGMTITSTLAATAWFARLEAEAQRERAEAEAETARQTTNFLVDLFKVSDPSVSLGNTITAREILDTGASRIESELQDQPEIQATLMDTMGSVYTGLGLYEPAVSLLESALHKRRETLGATHIEVASSLNHLGEVQSLKAEYPAAEKNLRDALAIRRAAESAPSALVASSLSDLAELLTLQGRYMDATPLIDEALALRKELYGDAAHAEIAESLEDLGWNQFYLGDYAHAVENGRAALDMRRAVHSGAHPALAEAVNNLALMLYETGDYDSAEALYEEALGMVRFSLGPEHKDIAAALINVALVLESQGDRAGAEANYREALAMQKRLLGESHPDIVGTLNNLAFLLYEDARIDEAIPMMRDALEMARRASGEDHPDVAALGTNLGAWLVENGQYEEAALLLDQALEIRKAAFGIEHPQVGGTLSVKANLLLATKDFVHARDLAREAHTVLAANLSADHWRVAMAESIEGAALTELGDFAAAEPLLIRSNEVLRKEGAAPKRLAQESEERLERLYAAWKK